MGLIPFFTLELRRFVALTANLEKCPRLELPSLFYGNQLAGISIFSVVTVAMLGI
jgi:hypothetical protein